MPSGRKSAADNDRLLRDSVERMRTILDTAVDAIITIDEQGRIDSFNRAAERLFGYSADEVLGRNVNLLMPSPYSEEHDGYIARYLRTAQARIIGIGREVVGRRKDGTSFPMDLAVSEVNLSDRRLFTGIVRDVTERKRAEEALASERELLAVTLRSVGDGVIATDIAGCVLLLSRMAERMTGWTQNDARGRPFDEVFRVLDEKSRKPIEGLVAAVLAADTPIQLARSSILVARDGRESRIDDICSPLHDRESRRIGVVVAFRDITEELRREQELVKSQKLESVGLLAGGIAHDFNNLLGEILVNVNLAKMSVQQIGDSLSILAEAEKAAARAKGLTQQLLTFSKGGAPVKRLQFLRDLVRDTVQFALSGSNVRGDLVLAEDLWPAEVDGGQISQVLNNLVLNAVQAMPGGGTLQVRAENHLLPAANPHDLDPGRYVRLLLQDNGPGILPEHLPRLFEPYFTTKPGGSGLGLATSYSIVKRHDGHIQADSSIGAGASFTILLPAAAGHAAQPSEEDEPAAPAGGRLLLMEDSDGLRAATLKMLGRLGYQVEAARHGAEAIEMYRTALGSGCPFDAVLMDLTITGGMGGKETIQRLLELDPQVRAIAASGYSTDPILAHFRDYGFQGVVAKPFGRKELADVLQHVLHGKPGRAARAAASGPKSDRARKGEAGK
jgi:PAS domain S-box-containing protein